MNEEKPKIAIIGGGVSGLAVAYNLLDPDNGFDCDVDIYEASGYLGGNADTALVDLGKKKEKGNNGEHLVRIADLGVDDFNYDTYGRIVKVMGDINFNYEEHYRPLEDTACFFTLDGSKVLTDDEKLNHGTSDPETAISKELATAYNDFMAAAVTAVLDKPVKYKCYTVARFVEDYISYLEDDKNVVLEDVVLVKEMRDCLLYPRINAMYFADDVTGPGGLPLRAVMRYYILQEGSKKGDGLTDSPSQKRHYFLNGAQAWIDALAKYLEEKYNGKDGKNGKLTIIRNSQANVFVEEDGKVVITAPSKTGRIGLPEPLRYNKVVMACHADDALRAIKQGMNQKLINVLGKVRYTNSIAVAHTFAGVLAPNRNAWRTYNVLIREGQGIHPYSMTYVMNRHRNDAAMTKYNKAGMPQYFVTLNPCVPIPDKYVLRTPKGEIRTPAGYFKQFAKNEEVLPGWRNIEGVEDKGQPVIGWFKHNVLNFDCLDAQEKLKDLQGGIHSNLYFAGGWTHGAGLHEECWEMAELVVTMIKEQEQTLQRKHKKVEQPETVC